MKEKRGYLRKSIFDKYLNQINKKVPVYLISCREMKKSIGSKCNGCLIVEGSYSQVIKGNSAHILILNNKPNYSKLYVLFHEYGHFLCYKKRCRCMEYLQSEKRFSESVYCQDCKCHYSQTPLCEAHAIEYCLSQFYNEKLWSCLAISFDMLINRYNMQQEVSILKKTEIWNKTKEVLCR